jgi:hypothetical protein
MKKQLLAAVLVGGFASSAAIADTNNAPRAPSGLFADPYGTRRGR